ncbi:MAG: FAD:protein FMN transferase [Vicinamibacterales bacterium]
MRCDSWWAAALVAACIVPASLLAGTDPLLRVHQQRYSMGTMFDIVAYHTSQAAAEDAIGKALDEIERLDRVLSHYRDDSDLARLIREGRQQFVAVDASLYEVLRTAAEFSERSGGRFDVTIGAVVKAWKGAQAEGRGPSATDLAAAKRCVGYQQIETAPPDRVRLRSDCLDIDLGGIGKGYAVDRAMGILRSASIRHAFVNAGSSSIAAVGHPPGQAGWTVRLGTGSQTILLRDQSLSTSQQLLVPVGAGATSFGEILDVRSGMPVGDGVVVTVVAPDATTADALSTTLLMMSPDEGIELLSQNPNVSALWASRTGELMREYRGSNVPLTGRR